VAVTVTLPEAITFVTGNAGKIEELRAVLDPWGIAVMPDDRGYPEIQHPDLAGVAEAGAGYLMATGLEPPFLLEDSGLFIAALKGFPGVYSRNALDTIGIPGILALMRDVELESRSAAFEANLCYVDAECKIHQFSGRCKGALAEQATGSQGFGFDPIFVPHGHNSTFAELGGEIKNKISHRSAAAAAFVAWLTKQ
jgi:XTP/dITP diphosphohydrolase